VCYENTFGYDSYITLYTVSVNTSWGQYELCNNNSCAGLNHHSVGREASFGVGYLGGQCTSNVGDGNWYSFDVLAHCPNGTTVGTNGCSWAIQGVHKTISADCLGQNGFFNACIADGGPPYASASQIFLNAFLFNSSIEGGCPDAVDFLPSAEELNTLPKMQELEWHVHHHLKTNDKFKRLGAHHFEALMRQSNSLEL